MRDSGTRLRRAAALAVSAVELVLLGGGAAEQAVQGPVTAPAGEDWVQLWETRRCQACGTEGEFWADL